MSTTRIELDQELLEQVASILGTTTKKATVNEALRRVVQRKSIVTLRNLLPGRCLISVIPTSCRRHGGSWVPGRQKRLVTSAPADRYISHERPC